MDKKNLYVFMLEGYEVDREDSHHYDHDDIVLADTVEEAVETFTQYAHPYFRGTRFFERVAPRYSLDKEIEEIRPHYFRMRMFDGWQWKGKNRASTTTRFVVAEHKLDVYIPTHV